MKTAIRIPTIPCFPARPLNGGPLATALQLGMLNPAIYGDRRAEPKFNGWRALVHVPTGEMWNRHGQRLTIEGEFRYALDSLRPLWNNDDIEWLDCEPLARRHGLMQGTLVVLDEVDFGMPYLARREKLAALLPRFERADLLDGKTQRPALLTPSYPLASAEHLYNQLAEENRALGLDGLNSFYEGIVLKDASSLYPCNKISSDRTFAGWTKHRFA